MKKNVGLFSLFIYVSARALAEDMPSGETKRFTNTQANINKSPQAQEIPVNAPKMNQPMLAPQETLVSVSEFNGLLKSNSLQFVMHPDFIPSPVISNRDVMYDYAIKHTKRNMEIRYRIWPISLYTLPADSKADRNSMFRGMLLCMAANILKMKDSKSQNYPAEGVKGEFGADAGATMMGGINSEFGRGYKMCFISVIHKDDIADAYTFVLADELKDFVEFLSTDQPFHALKFCSVMPGPANGSVQIPVKAPVVFTRTENGSN